MRQRSRYSSHLASPVAALRYQRIPRPNLSAAALTVVHLNGPAHARSPWAPRGSGGARHPARDRAGVNDAGAAAIYTPRDFRLAKIMADIVALVAAHRMP